MSWEQVYNLLRSVGGRMELAGADQIKAATAEGRGDAVTQLAIAQAEYARELRKQELKRKEEHGQESTLKPVVNGLPSGKALCIVEVFDCVPMQPCHESEACCKWYAGAWSWMLRNIRQIEPFSVKGGRGFYDVQIPMPVALAGSLRDQVVWSRSAGKFLNSQ